uniref:Crp/Fnr family transcriptional regulator n=1 Tax=Cupriavidus yeoncheonensis TaxID=1462994 RepID=UPI003F495853
MNLQGITSQVSLILAPLGPSDWEVLSPGLELVRLRAGQLLSDPGQRIRHVYFPKSAVVAVSSLTLGGEGIEVAVVGHEGLVGLPVLTGGDTMPYRIEVRCTGFAYRLPANDMREAFRRLPVLRRQCLLFVQALLTQVAQTAVCNRHHSLQEQLCRWLLLTLDRMTVNELAITQQEIADALGVRREGVAVAMGRLSELGLIRHSRGRVAEFDRQGLEQLACDCYRQVRSEYERLLPPAAQDMSDSLRQYDLPGAGDDLGGPLARFVHLADSGSC